MPPNGAEYFIRPKHDWQRRYEALRASFVERMPARVVAERYGYAEDYVYLLRHNFKRGAIDFSEPVPEGKINRRKIDAKTRETIRSCRERGLTAGEIAQLLSEDGKDVSVRTIERVLAEEGFERLPRRTRLKIGRTVKGAHVPKKARSLPFEAWRGKTFDSEGAGLFIFAPFLRQLDMDSIVRKAGLPGTKMIPAASYFLSFLALKLLGTERFAHVGDHAFDPGLGLFSGLNGLPKCTALSTYSYGLDEVHLERLQRAFIKQGHRRGLYDGKIVNLDFHTVPHFGDESVLEKHWAGTRGKAMKGALTLFAQDAQSKLILYTAADIRRSESADQVIEFISFWKNVKRGVSPTLVFDSRFTSYAKLSDLNQNNIKFITLRRRGINLLKHADQVKEWKRVHIPHPKRKFPNPLVYEETISMREYDSELRQVIIKGNGRENPTFLITNDFEMPLDMLVGEYSRRWRVENLIGEAVKFFHLNALSSPILIKVHFDIIMTMVADTLYTMLARRLRGFEDCDAPTLFRRFIKGKGTITVKDREITVKYPRRAHNPILRAVSWNKLPMSLPWLNDAKLNLCFQ